MANGLIDVQDATFETLVLKSEKPVLVDFWAPWCGPCRAIGPVVEELAGQYGDRMVFSKCNVDESQEVPGKYQIKAIPTLIFFKNGAVVHQLTGMASKAALEEIIQKVIAE